TPASRRIPTPPFSSGTKRSSARTDQMQMPIPIPPSHETCQRKVGRTARQQSHPPFLKSLGIPHRTGKAETKIQDVH
ncbi:hypothetical protein ADUPG1_002507, partial [Aduncisulcus paluster]